MHRSLLLFPLVGIFVLLTGCLYNNPPSGPSKSIDAWLIGQWETKDKAGHQYHAVVTRAASDHYHFSLQGKSGAPLEFDGWLSRVDNFSILVVKSLNHDATSGKYALYHYELLAPGTPPPGGVGATRIRLSELQLDESARTLDSFQLRAAIRSALKNGTLLPPYDVVVDLNQESKLQAAAASDALYLREFVSSGKFKTNTPSSTIVPPAQEVLPGSIIWIKTGGVTLKGETF